MSINKVSGSNSSTQQNQAVTTPRVGTASTDFDSFMMDVLRTDKGKKIGGRASEEELFSGLVQYQVKTTLGDEKLAEFQDILLTQSLYLQNEKGVRSWEDATREALLEFKARESATEDEVNAIYSTSFAAAQLDDKTDELWDRRGDTKTVMKIGAALEKVKAAMGEIESSAISATAMSVPGMSEMNADISGAAVGVSNSSESSNSIKKGNPKDGGGGFVFKPISESDGKLAIITPPSYTGKIDSVILKTLNGDVIEEGRSGGVGNGGREHFRYRKPGGSYPQDLVVEMLLKDGSSVQYNISDPKKRWD